MNERENLLASRLRASLLDTVRASGAAPTDTVSVVAQMLAVARLFPCACADVPMGFFDPGRELTPNEWRVFQSALRIYETREPSLPRLHRRSFAKPTASADAIFQDRDGRTVVIEAKFATIDRYPGGLERLRRLLMEVLPRFTGGERGPKPPSWLIYTVLALATDDRASPLLQPQDEIQELLCLLAYSGIHRTAYCAFEGTAGTALRIAADGARVTFDIPNEDLAQLVYWLALAGDLPLTARTFHPILESREEKDEVYDAAIAVPPLGCRYAPGSIPSVWPKDHSADALHFLLLLRRARGPVAFLAADGFLFRNSQAERFFKERLVNEYDLSAVISLPRGTFPRTAVNVSLLYRAPLEPKRAGPVFLLDARRDGDVRQRFSEQSPVEIAEIVRDHRLSERSCLLDKATLLKNEFNLLVERYVLAPETRNVHVVLGRTQTALLNDLVEIFRPQALPVSPDASVAFREVAASDIDSATGTVRLPAKRMTLTREVAAKARRAVLEPGDLILSIKGRIGVVGLVENQSSGDEPWVPGQSFAVLRPRRSSAISESRVLYRYLSSELGQQALKGLAGGATVPFVQIADVRRLEVPIPSEDDLLRIADGEREIEELNDQVISILERISEIQDTLWPMNLAGRVTEGDDRC